MYRTVLTSFALLQNDATANESARTMEIKELLQRALDRIDVSRQLLRNAASAAQNY
jgi:hypothetical protein